MKKLTAIAILEWFAWGILAVFIVLIVVASFTTIAYGAEISIGYGAQINWNPSWCSESVTHEVVEVEAYTEKGPWTFGLVGQRLGSLTWPGHIVDSLWYEGTNNTSAVHFRLGLRGSKGKLSGRLFGGLGLHSGQQVEIGDSGVLAHFGAEVGLKFGRVSLSYSLTHMSDPLQHHDFGWNYQMLKIGFSF